jgi:hypothetical protein
MPPVADLVTRDSNAGATHSPDTAAAVRQRTGKRCAERCIVCTSAPTGARFRACWVRLAAGTQFDGTTLRQSIMANVLLERVFKHFATVKVIEGLDLHVEDREFLVRVARTRS